jgi:hypothetical protein
MEDSLNMNGDITFFLKKKPIMEESLVEGDAPKLLVGL